LLDLLLQQSLALRQSIEILIYFDFYSRELFTLISDGLVSLGDDVSDFMPLLEYLMSLVMVLLELLGRFVEFNLRGLRLGYLFIDLSLFFAHFACQLFYFQI
jgi:hypothetical protein